MKRRHRLDMLVWLALLIVAALEFGAAFLPIPPGTRPILMLPAAVTAVLVALGVNQPSENAPRRACIAIQPTKPIPTIMCSACGAVATK